jgi:Na+/H+ antiporter NhaD/arsenite permease-like protein
MTMPLDIRRRARAQAPFLLVLALLVVGVVYMAISPGHWRRGTGAIAGALLLAAIFRVLVPPAHIGLLAIRGKYWDTLCFALLGLLIFAVDMRLQK